MIRIKEKDQVLLSSSTSSGLQDQGPAPRIKDQGSGLSFVVISTNFEHGIIFQQILP